MRLKPAALAFVLLCSGAAQAYAQQAPAAVEAPAAQAFVTRHSGVFNGQKVKYTATVGETVLRNESGEPTIRFVTTSYVRDGVKDRSSRPVLFLFNGGPSSSSSWLHMGAFGPRRISPPQDVNAEVPKPYKVVDNSYSLLDAADLVFIDPAETGFTRVLPAARRADFYDANGDARSVSQFVEAWLKANGREASPKYVLGESYGTIRAAIMAGQLAKTAPLDGVVLMGQAVNMIETSQRPGNPLSYATNLTVLAAVAAYHGKADTGGKTIAAFVDEAYAFGMNEYLPALLQGADLPASERDRIATRLQSLTGISSGYYLSHDLIISKVAFTRELLKDQGLLVGTYDARYVGPAPAAGQRGADPFDKVGDMIRPAIEAYMAQDLGVTWPMADYRAFAPDTGGWAWSPTGGIGSPFNDFDYQANFGHALKANPNFRLMIGTGRYDTTTTAGPARYLKARGVLPSERVTLKDYEGGHMAYTNEEALKAFSDDVRAFVTGR